MNENQYNCKHDWRAKAIEGTAQEGTSTCYKCNLVLNNSNRLQLEMNRHAIGFQKKISIITIVISTIALIVSVVAIFK